MYVVRLRKRVVKEIEALPRRERERIMEAISELETVPFPHGCKKLQGHENSFRIRIGDYRIVYSVYQSELVVEVLKVGHRRDVYEK